MLKFITVQLRKDQRAAKRRNLLSKKNMPVQLWFAKLHLNSKTTGQRKQNWRCLAIMDITMFDENQTLYISTNTSYQLWRAVVERRCLDLFCSNRTWAHCSHWVDHEFLCILKCSRVKCEAICPIANTWLSLGPRTRQWWSSAGNLRQNGWTWNDSKTQPKFRLQLTKTLWEGLWELCVHDLKKCHLWFLHKNMRDW